MDDNTLVWAVAVFFGFVFFVALADPLLHASGQAFYRWRLKQERKQRITADRS